MPSKRKATSPASKPESSSASRKSKRLATKPDPVVAPPADSDFEESEPVLSSKKKSTRRTTEKEAVDSQSKRRAVENSGPFVAEKAEPDPDPEVEDCAVESDFVEEVDETEHGTLKKSLAVSPSKRKPKRGEKVKDEECVLSGESVPDAEARQRWPHRYNKGTANGTKSLNGQDDDQQLQAKCHFTQASVDGQIYYLEDDAHVKAADGEEDYICKIVEFFEAVDGMQYFTAQWFYRAKDTVIKSHDQFIDKKRVFLSEIKDDNPIDCLVIKLKIVPVPSNATLQFKENAKSNCDFYYDMMYLLPYSSFLSLPPDSTSPVSSSSTISSDTDAGEVKEHNLEKKLLDLYSGCGAMSTGLCLGANSNGVKLVTKWAVDLNRFACDSLRLNHPGTQVRNEYASDFLSLLKEWVQLCSSCSLVKSNVPPHPHLKVTDEVEEDENDDESEDSGDNEEGEIFEVEEILEVCYGDPNAIKKPGLYFKVRWQGYGPEEDTWEPIDGLSECPKKIREFVTKGFKANLLPLPGDVDVICGGPPCQGISGFNRFRNKENPLGDPKNQQLDVFMDIVDFLKPRFVLMENVVDLIKFSNGFLGRYALGRLVGMNYQARMGMMAAGAYGLPQFRMRVFMWGALSSEKLPQYPLPTHKVIVRGVIPTEFESNTVAFDEGRELELKKELFLGDALSDLPSVENNEQRDEMAYTNEPTSDFQHFIRLGRDGALGSVLYDHRPLQLNDDDYQRVCQIPKRKGANFRDLPGVRVRSDNKVEWDPDVERVKLPSGKPLVPDYAMSFVGGSSTKPFGRLWWDETVPTVVTRAEPHNQTIIHPQQNRVLTIREHARLHGFPDYYKLTGPIKERYIQVGNAVAVPVARALGYSLAMAMKGSSDGKPLMSLPENFPSHAEQIEVSQ
ncbi:PREDICTED: DNA (cytosine-5)-methyltransferase CMT3-like [Nicotiana attenuata]|uniref:DNA (cytosine-5-)-methyltransferase n=1 Tax=Nicotiana attenuata TaxID=49451 RepID=A0A1J6HVV0_NICAT|nr:PREDICTED: DNA (cytosine-5)-methyltransferase CMT3-like [Nicotiana attenuata]OIS96505.1 dna (cytosine-5)-methyltransferase 3 [Nicotiana attenuata]